jgi:PAS domain S-box-containing protein
MRMTVRKSSAKSADAAKLGAAASRRGLGRAFSRIPSAVVGVVRVVLGTKATAGLMVTAQFVLGTAGLALITFSCFQLGLGIGRTGLAYVILLTLLSPLGSFSASVFLSIAAAACLNFFFAPPLFEFRIDVPEDIERIAAFLTASLVVTALTSKLKNTANELRQNQSNLEKAQGIAHFGWWERDFKTKHVSLSDEACRIFGVQPLDLPEWHGRWLDLIHPDDRARAANAAAAALVRGSPRYDVEYRVVRPDGTQRVVRSQGDVTWDNSGRPLRQFGVMQDITELRQAEQELRASEAKLERAQAIAHVGWWDRDFTRNRVSHSEEAYRIFGLNPGELPEWSGEPRELVHAKLIHPEDRAKVLEKIAAALIPGGPRYDIEYRIVRPNGAVRMLHSQGDVTRDETGRPLRQFGVLQDITDLRQTERELRASEARFRTFVDYATDGFFLFDDHATVLDVNRQACESLGYSREELIGKHPTDFDVGLDQSSIERLRDRMLAGETVTFETRHKRKDGTHFPVEIRAGQFEQSGRRYLSLVRDITERKQAEDELRASEERFRILVDHASDAFFLYDENGTVLDVNRRACESLGYGRDELIGMTAFDYGPDLTPELLQRIRERLRSGKIVSYDGRQRRKDGTLFPVEVRIQALWRQGKMLAVSLDRDITERKRAETELFETKERFRVLSESSLTGIYLIEGGRFGYVNPAFANMFGYAAEEVVDNLGPPDLVHPDDRPLVMENIRRRSEGEVEEVRYEFRGLRKDGSAFPAEVHGRAIEHNGKPAILGTILDNTQRQLAEQELRESEERFRTLVQFSFDVYWETDVQHRFTRREFGPDVAFMRPPIGKTPWELPFVEPDAEAWRKHRETRDAHQPFRDFEVARPAADGGKRYISISGLPVFDKSGAFVGYRGVGRDITARKRAEEALRRSEAYLAEAERLTNSGAFAYGPKESLYWSEGLYRLWGFDPREGIPSRQSWWQRVHPDDRDRAREQHQDALHQKRDYAIEYRIVLPGGIVKHVRAIGHPSYSASGELIEVVGTTLDVTEQKRAREERERARQLEADLAHLNRLSVMGELTASLAHEVLHPIGAARNNARAGMNFLETNPPKLAKVKEALGCVVRDADRAKDIVGRIRDQIKKAPPRMELFDLNGAIDEVLVMVRNATERERVSVRTRLMAHLPCVWGDRVQLQQVILNLILNAVEAMSSVEEGMRELSISTELSQASNILIAVRDSGPGIDAEHLDRIFKPFYTTKISGIGMGLSICRSIIDAHGGQLWAEGNRPQGAIFQFTLPSGGEDS